MKSARMLTANTGTKKAASWPKASPAAFKTTPAISANAPAEARLQARSLTVERRLAWWNLGEMNGASSLAIAASTAGSGPLSAAIARMHTPLREKACESLVDSEVVTLTLCDLLQTVRAMMKAIRSGLCQLERMRTAAPTIAAVRAKKNAVQRVEGDEGASCSAPGPPGLIADTSRMGGSAAGGAASEGRCERGLRRFMGRFPSWCPGRQQISDRERDRAWAFGLCSASSPTCLI